MSYAKYRNKPTHYDGHRFDSKRELKRYQELQLLVRAGEIANLELQPSWSFSVDGVPVVIRSQGFPNGRKMTYRADFSYTDKNGTPVIEDAKGFKTPEYKIKKALMEACHGIVVKEV